jgi:hypothetical protein
MRRVFAICGLLVSTVLPVDGGDKLNLAATPAKSLAPSTVTVRVRIEPNADNRALTVVVDSGQFYRSSDIPLNGEAAQRLVHLQYPNLPGGEYGVYGVLTDQYGRRRAMASQLIEIISTLGH